MDAKTAAVSKQKLYQSQIPDQLTVIIEQKDHMAVTCQNIPFETVPIINLKLAYRRPMSFSNIK